MSLARFADALLSPSAPLPPGLIDPLGRPAHKRFDVYRNNVFSSLIEAMEVGFPLIRSLMGNEAFTTVSVKFFTQHPPKTPLLMFYGDVFADFLENYKPLAAYPYLGDIARLEFLVRESYYAADAAAISHETLASLSIEALLAARIILAPSLRILRSRWPVYSVWHANTQDGPDPQPGAEDVLIMRPEFDPSPYLLPKGSADVLLALGNGKCLSDALDTSDEVDLTALLTLLLQGGAIIEVQL